MIAIAVYVCYACMYKIPSTPKTLPKKTRLSTPQFGHGPLATNGSLKNTFSVTDLLIAEIGSVPVMYCVCMYVCVCTYVCIYRHVLA